MNRLVFLLVLFLVGAAQADESCSVAPYVPYYIVDPEGYKNIVQGSDGWIFNGKQDLLDHYTISPANLALFQQLTKVLHAHGTEFIIAYIPTHSMAVPGALPLDNALVKERNFNPQTALRNYTALIKQMNAAGVAIVGNTSFDADNPYFNKRDEHWTDSGARQMAQGLADYIKQHNWMKPVVTNPEHNLLTSADFTHLTLLGTSFSGNAAYEDGLVEFLHSANIWNAAIDGGGLDDAINAYLTSAVYRNEAPKILVWEIPGYYDLNSVETATVLRRAIAAVQGDCVAERIISNKHIALDGAHAISFAPSSQTIALPAAAYIEVDFGKQLGGGMALSYRGADGQGHCVQFEQPFVPPADGRFYYLLPDASAAALSTLQLMPPTDMTGVTVDAKLCAIVSAP